MSVKGVRATRARGRTSAGQLVAAAVAIVDSEGVDALSIRRLAAECGVSPMAIYRHVRDKDDLLDQVVDEALADLDDIATQGDWRSKLTGLFVEARRVLLDHPGVASVCIERSTPVPRVVRFYDQVLAALGDGGFRGPRAVFAMDALIMFLFGSVLWQRPRSERERERLVGAALARPGRASHVLEHAGELAVRNPDEHFEFGLRTILDGLAAESRLTRRAAARSGR